MHADAFYYVQKIAAAADWSGAKVLEIGSLNVNGSVRPLFAAANSYTGIDKLDGPGVDQVQDVRDFEGTGYDLVISTEVLEHDPEPWEIIEAAAKALKPGGRIIFTMAGPGRAAHNVNGTTWDGAEHYENIDPEDLRLWLSGWEQVQIEENAAAYDLYVSAQLPEAYQEPEPQPEPEPEPKNKTAARRKSAAAKTKK